MAKSYGTAGRGARKIAWNRFKSIAGWLIFGYIVSVLYAWIASAMFKRHDTVSEISGFGFAILSIFLGISVVKRARGNKVLDEPIERAIRGATAEETVSDILDKLPDEYEIFHDVVFPRGNIDHIVVGPTGIFVIETKSHTGNITVSSEGKLLRNSFPFENNKDFIRQALNQAYWLRDELDVPFVNAIVVFTRAFVKVRDPIKGVRVLNKKWLLDSIISKPRKLESNDIERMKTIISSFIKTEDRSSR